MELKYKKCAASGEEVFYGTHGSGLEIFIIPKKDYSKSYAIFGTRYGSMDSEFVVPDETEVTSVPDGIAHYLEHKMFDQPDNSNVFDKFSQLGANANAFTSFNITAYLFSATENVAENVAVLLDYVQSPYFTKESVQKEQGIIGQEIRMYDDNGEWRVFFNLLKCLYHELPVKKEIAGTVESISHITDELLYRCYNTFYNLSNMAIVVIGDVDPVGILKVIEDNIKSNEPFDAEIKRIYPDEPDTIAKPYAEQKLSVAMPIFMMGFKDTDTGFGGRELLKKSIETEILLKMLFGKSTQIYKRLYDEGLINGSFAFSYSMQPSYAYSSIEGESKDPKRVYEMITDEVERVKANGLLEEDFERIKKVIWGEHIRSLNDVESFATSFLQLKFMDIDYFDYYDVYKSVTFEDVKKRFTQHFVKDRCALSVVWPSGEQ